MNQPQEPAPQTISPGSSQIRIAVLAVICIAAHLVARYAVPGTLPETTPALADIPLYVALVFGGIPLVFGLLRLALQGEFGSDLLAGISIVTSVFLEQYLAGTFVVLMLSGG